MTVGAAAQWLSVAVVLISGGVAYGTLNERQEKNDFLLTQHERELGELRHSVERMREDNTLLERIHSLEIRIEGLTDQVQELNAQLHRGRR